MAGSTINSWGKKAVERKSTTKTIGKKPWTTLALPVRSAAAAPRPPSTIAESATNTTTRTAPIRPSSIGAPIEEGLIGAVLVIVLVALAATAIGGLGAAAALRTGKASVVQGFFPIVFVVLFLSTAFFPQDLMVEPAKTIATYNPLSFIVNGIRDPIVYGNSGTDLLKAVVSIAGIGLLGLAMSASALRHRLRTGG